jgi:uncharacterized protein YndB with AHSA1/START domain
VATQTNRSRASTANADSARVTTPSAREIVITRTFDAPPTTVFDAWTHADHVRNWWDPSGTQLSVCEIDLRPNGKFRWVHGGSGAGGHAFAGTYKEIARPGRLVFTQASPSGGESIGTLTFDEDAGRTRLTITITCASEADRDALLSMRVDVGTVRTLENLANYLSGRLPASFRQSVSRRSGR